MNFQFDVNVYGNFEKVSPVLSKARVRIFYTGLNKNLTYITEEFAKKLLDTLPYTPIVGKYNGQDFTDHGKDGDNLQVYGVVPENPNIQWESHLDKDGVERNYACADVLLWTARCGEASAITEKSQSMELYPKSIQGQWVCKDGLKYFKFSEGCFLGLTALGDTTEPCFEGAAFYSYSESLKELAEELKKYNLNNKEGGNKEMAMDFNFKLSDDQKRNAIFRLINPRLETEGYIDYSICEIYDDYALCFSYEDGKYERFYYTKNDEDNSVVIDRTEQAYVLDVTQSEYEALERIRQISNTYTEFETKYNELNEQVQDNQNNQTTIQNYEIQIQTLENEKSTSAARIEELEAQNSQFSQQITELSEYKTNNETSLKEELISKYSKVIPEDILTSFKEKLAEYSVEDFKKELALSAVENNATVLFEKKTEEIVPTGSLNKGNDYSGAQRLVNKYKKTV